MSGAPVGARVAINPYDWYGEGPAPGEDDYLVSQGGSVYLILEARQVRSAVHANRWAYRCLKVAPDEVREGARWTTLVWSRRERRRGRR